MTLTSAALDEVVKLEGTWLAMAAGDSTHFTSYAYDDRHWQPVSIPAMFTAQGFPNEGQVWYRLHLRFPDAVPRRGYIQYAGYAHTLYAARPGEVGLPIARSGVPTASPEVTAHSRRPVSFTLPPDTALVLTWRVANYDYTNGGPFYAIYVGDEGPLTAFVSRRATFSFVYASLYLIITIFFFLNWFWYRGDVHSLAVALVAFSMMVRTLILAGFLELYLPEIGSFQLRIWVEGTSFFMLIGACGFLLWTFFPKEFATVQLGRFTVSPPKDILEWNEDGRASDDPPLPHGIRLAHTVGILAAIASSILLIVITAFLTTMATAKVLAGFRFATLVYIVVALAIVIQARMHRRPRSRGMLFGFGLLIVGGVHDILVSMWVIQSDLYIASHVFLGFVLVQGYLVARRNAHYAGELRDATRVAQDASIAKSQFITAVSHEIRTPLSAITGYTQLLQEELDPSITEHHRDFLQTIRDSSNRVLMLVNDLLDLAKIESGKLDLALAPVSLDEVVSDAIRQMSPLALNKGLQLEGPRDGSDYWVEADALRLHQVLINLVANAIKFTETGSVKVRLGRSKLHDHAACTIYVADTGVGISPEFMPHLFGRFTQEQRTYSKTHRGTGLGLALSQELVHGMGGEISVESDLGLGSVFSVTLPRIPPPTPEAEEARALTERPVWLH